MFDDDRGSTTARQWLSEATAALGPVRKAAHRLSASIELDNEVAILAAADEVQTATTDATMWLTATTWPDARLRAHVAGMLNTCAEVALAARRAVADPADHTPAAMDRLRDLLSVFDLASRMMTAW